MPVEQEYTAAEREREIQSLRSPKKRHGKTWRELRPRSLLRAVAAQGIYSREQIRQIVETEYSDPVVSLYLGLDPQKVTPKEKGVLRSFHAMRTRALEQHKDFIDGLSKSQKAMLDHDLAEIAAFLAEDLLLHNLRSLVVFKSGAKLNSVTKLGVRARDALVIDPDPYVLPLETVLEIDERVLFVQTSKEESRFQIYSLGILEEVDRIQSFVPSDSVDKSIPGHVQRHRLTHLQWHLKQTATQTYRVYNERSCDTLALMAETRVAALLEEYLHDSLKPKIIARIHDSPDADKENRRQLVEATVREHRAARETRAIDGLANYVPGEDLICGLRQVIAALNLFFVRKLFISESVSEKGFVCRAHHYLSLQESLCPFDNSKLVDVENIIDEIMEVAQLHGVEVMLIEQRQELMSKYDGIAAVKYRGMSAT